MELGEMSWILTCACKTGFKVWLQGRCNKRCTYEKNRIPCTIVSVHVHSSALIRNSLSPGWFTWQTFAEDQWQTLTFDITEYEINICEMLTRKAKWLPRWWYILLCIYVISIFVQIVTQSGNYGLLTYFNEIIMIICRILHIEMLTNDLDFNYRYYKLNGAVSVADGLENIK